MCHTFDVLFSDGASGEGGHPGIEKVPANLPGPGAGTPRPDLTGPGLCWLCVCLVVLCLFLYRSFCHDALKLDSVWLL